MKNHLLLFFTLFSIYSLHSQSNIRGKIIDSVSGEPIIFANIYEAEGGANTETNLDGEYSLIVSDTATVIVSYVGYKPYQFKVVPGVQVYDIKLQSEAVDLENVVVTAFGIEKDKKAAGFAFTEVGGDELNQAREISVASQLVGKVAGLEITKPSNGPGGATRISIRGLAQFGNNSPLIIIDGIIIDNTNANTAGLFGGRDSGDGLTALNPDDIENITVIKGLSATALYGSRGANGALVITTKSGGKRKGVGVEFSSNFSTDQVTILPNYQEEYGQGANGLKPTSQQEAFDNWRSWGARLDGSETPIFNGETLPYSPVGQDDIGEFYDVGQTFTNTLGLTAGNDKINTRTSFTYINNKSIVPRSTYEKLAANINLSYSPINKLSFDAKINLIQENADNRTNLTDNPSNPAKYFTIAPANLPQSVFESTRDEAGEPIYWSNNPFTLSPYWGINENINSDQKNRIITSGSARYEILDWLSATFRASTDRSRQDFLNVEIDGTQHNIPGSIFLDTVNIRENNLDFLLSADKPIHENLGIQLNFGLTRNDRFLERNGLVGLEFLESRLIDITNTNILRQSNPNIARSRINAIFANMTVSINNFLYVEASIRQDYFSVLTNPLFPDESDNSSLYGGGSLSFILSDAVALPKWVSFAKFRFGLGSVGLADVAPHSQFNTFILSTDPKEVESGTLPIANINGDRAANPFLRPSRTVSTEYGVDFRFFKNRLGIDFAYYNQVTSDHILPNPLPASSGFNTFTQNAGEVRNRGIELLLNISPVRTAKFKWDASINFARNRNTVVSLNDDVDQLNFGADRTFSANIIAQVGGQIGDIWGNVYDRNEAGQIIHDENGLPQIAENREILGNFTPDWSGGITNTFTYDNFSLSFLIDAKQGGEILSTTSSFGYLFGRHVLSLEGRDSEDFTIVGAGVGADGVTTNTEAAKLDTYYERLSNITEINVYDASFIKLRQLTVGYTFKKATLEKLKIIKGLNLSLVGRNLLFFENGLDELGLDPEAIYTATGTDFGIEYSALPSTRSIGINLKVTF